jgi:amidase
VATSSSSSTKPLSLFDGATQMADAVRTKQISAAELLELTFKEVDRRNPALNAIVWQCRDEAMARAKQADQALAKGRVAGPLHGVPVTIKESFAYGGSPNTWGLPPLKDARSPRTAIAVERLESAGAIVFGKTNVPVMLGDWQSYNPIYGTTNNPWDTARTPGGSTGGGAAAIAAGLGALTLGSDLNGSIRIPAHFCGVYGHKTSLDVISMDGFQPGPWDGTPGYPTDIAVVGPLARSARDLATTLTAIGGPDGDGARAWTWRLPAPRRTRLRDFRIGCVRDDFARVNADVRTVYDHTLAALRDAGAAFDDGWPDGIDPQAQLNTFLYLVGTLISVDADPAERDRARERFARNPHDVFAAAAVEPHARWLQETRRRLAARAAWQRYFSSHDIFLMPASTTAAIPHDHSEPIDRRAIDTDHGKRPYVEAIPAWMPPASLAGLPATIAPVGKTRGGLPVGIQIVGPMWEDATTIGFAEQLADVVGGFTAP